MARFVEPANVGSISIILNAIDEMQLADDLHKTLAAYGPLANKVKVVRGDDILRPKGKFTSPSFLERAYVDYRYRIPFVRRQGWRGNNGYRMQQALKLASARCANSESIVLLDTKNVFLRDLSRKDFFTDEGLGRVPFASPTSSFHRNWLRESLAALDVGREVDDIEYTTTFATPYPVSRQILFELLDELEDRFGSVQALFASKRRPSEFMLINAWCLKHYKSPKAWFEKVDPSNVGIWPDFAPDKIEAELRRLSEAEPLSLGLHNRAVSRLRYDQKEILLDALAQRGICKKSVAAEILRRTDALDR